MIRFAHSLEYRLVTLVGFGLLLCSLLAGIFTYNYTYNRQLEAARSLQDQLVRTIQAQAEVAAFAFNVEIAEGVLDGLMANPVILAVKIDAMENFKHERLARAQVDFNKATVYPLHSPVDSVERIGNLLVVQNEVQVDNEAAQYAFIYTIVMLIQVAVAAVLLTFTLRSVMTRPVAQLAQGMLKIRPGGGERLEVDAAHAKNEIGLLSNSVNALLDAAESAIHEERTLRTALDTTGRIARVGGWTLELATQTLTLSDEIYRIHDMEPHASLSIEEAIANSNLESQGIFRAAVSIAIAQGKPFDLELPWTTFTGRSIWVRAQGQCEIDRGRAIRLYGAFQDITERKQLQDEILRHQEQLEHRVIKRTAELEATMESLHRSQEELTRSEAKATLSVLVASVSHEMSTPIGNSVMASSTLADHVKSFQSVLETGQLKRSDMNGFVKAVHDGVALLQSNLQRAQNLLRNFKQVAADQASEQRRRFDLATAIKEVVQTLTPSIKHRPHRVTVDVPNGIEMDSFPGPLGQIVINLINNAYLHAFDDSRPGVFSIRAELEGPRVHLIFSDNGMGIKPEDVERMFQPFFSTKIGQGGTGLGMSIVDNLVHKTLSGDLKIRSVVGVGTTIDVFIPRVVPSE
ncbi:MAG TPA: ATP-binding protein [Rhodocyclaceae bacterium]|nr:ATP-binding protein [Rhodocyclaceae bacterium]